MGHFLSKPVFSGFMRMMYTLCFSRTSKELKTINFLLINGKDQVEKIINIVVVRSEGFLVRWGFDSKQHCWKRIIVFGRELD